MICDDCKWEWCEQHQDYDILVYCLKHDPEVENEDA